MLGEHSGDGGLADVRADEDGVAQLVPGRDRVDGDHPVHFRITLDTPHEPAAQLPGRSRDEHDLPQDQRLPSVSREVSEGGAREKALPRSSP